MSNQAAFAQFPALKGEGAYHLIDIYKIEAVSQSSLRTGAVIFGPTDRFYAVEVDEETLDKAEMADAACYVLETILRVQRQVDGFRNFEDLPREFDDEDDFDEDLRRAAYPPR